MVISEIMGGFGNQLFSYACAYATAKRNNDTLILDKHLYDCGYFRRFQLDQLNIDCTETLLPPAAPFDRYKHPFRTKFYEYRRNRKLPAPIKMVREQNEFAYIPEQFAYDTNIHLTGYWQNYRYFDQYRQDLLRQYIPKAPFRSEIQELLSTLRSTNSAAIHIRRGDYVNFKGGKCLSPTYYRKALNLLQQSAGPDLRLYIFSDDIPYVKQALSTLPSPIFLSDSLTLNDLEEFYLMSACRHQIIANSTFSWWAAYLNPNPSRRVIAPLADLWTNDFYLPDWTAIQAEIIAS